MKTPHDPYRIDRACLRYLDAIDADDFDTMSELWFQAETDPELETALCELIEGLDETDGSLDSDAKTIVLHELRDKVPSGFLPEAEPLPVTVAEVAARLVSECGSGIVRLFPDDQVVNKKLLTITTRLPAAMGGAEFDAWSGTLKVKATKHYWREFRRVAMLLQMGRSQQNARTAARKGSKP